MGHKDGHAWVCLECGERLAGAFIAAEELAKLVEHIKNMKPSKRLEEIKAKRTAQQRLGIKTDG